MAKNFEFDKKTIVKNCKDFFVLYDITEGKIREMCNLKAVHTQAVAENCVYIAENLGLDNYDRDFAWIIGELHDFARFGQIVKTHTFADTENYDHAKLGARLLFHYGMIYDIIPNYDNLPDEDKIVLEKAIYYHNGLTLPDGLTEREKFFCKLIRDADKIDIFRTIETSRFEAIYNKSKEELFASEDLSEEIMAAFYRHELADFSKRKFPGDYRLAHIALIFGLESPEAKRRVLVQGYLHQMLKDVYTKPEVQEKFLKVKNCVYEVMPELNY